MKKIWISLLFFFLLLGGTDTPFASIGQRIIHAGDTPLASTCTVAQTGPMELTVSKCSFTTTGQAKILSRLDSAFAMTGLGEVAQALQEGKAEWHGSRVRVWLRDKQGNIIERSKTHVRNVATTVTVPGPGQWVVYLIYGPGINLNVVLQLWSDPRPTNYVEYIVMPFVVTVGTTNLNTINLEVFTVLPGFPPPKGMFEK